MSRISITKEYTAEYAHFLNLPYESKCSNIHGHSARIVVTIFADTLNNEGMIIDFSHIDIDDIINKLDHALIIGSNEKADKIFMALKPFNLNILTFEFEPTSETFAMWLTNNILYKLVDIDKHDEIIGVEVTFYETAKNRATYRKMTCD